MLRNPKTISVSDVVIEDPIMEPFFITKSQTGGYTVFERVIKGKKDTDYLRTVCYPSSFNYALKVVSKELLGTTEKKHFGSIREYITAWEEVQLKMQTMTTIE